MSDETSKVDERVKEIRLMLCDSLCEATKETPVEATIASVQLACAAITSLPGGKGMNVLWGLKLFLMTIEDLAPGNCMIDISGLDDVDIEHEAAKKKRVEEVH